MEHRPGIPVMNAVRWHHGANKRCGILMPRSCYQMQHTLPERIGAKQKRLLNAGGLFCFRHHHRRSP